MTNVENAKSDIQGFITSGYGHTYHAAYLFLTIDDVPRAKAWLSKTIPDVLTAESWRPDSLNPCGPDEERLPKEYPQHILNIAVSFEGLIALGLSYAALRTFPTELQQGMAHETRAPLLGDTEESDPQHWQIGGPNNVPFHMLLLLHAGSHPDDEDTIKAFVAAVIEGLDGLSVMALEWGHRRLDDKEHFGFRDGISQPYIEGINFYDSDGQSIHHPLATGEFILGHLNQYGLYPTVPAIPLDEDPANILPVLENPRHIYPLYRPNSLKDLGANGTYIAYRKLRQDVPAFWRYIASEVERIDGTISAERMMWLASKMVGRWPNGDPLVSQPDALKNQNDFHYAEDMQGEHCPFGSHLRRSNPRDVLSPLNASDSNTTTAKHRILRRGRNYGEPLFDLSILDDLQNVDQLDSVLRNLDDDATDRGIQFFCVNASIQRQFEFIQVNWSNNPNFNAMYQNKDPLIGDNARAAQAASYMHIPASPVRVRTSPLPRFVTVIGGSYLFMPSITALRFLAYQP
ncbi:hypothetical protein G4Y79_13060 [Phototrophicus methaneseepsis]|uniref:Peroxidase n=1 Tax=Phototrophicus methaneseepsis TaxID=2710758 RepID=A0A7S8ICM6_9CHLR|nr:hypothetical protein [Phototrophicus methaneseepsis]QPC80641.1 hypothetical protein G4Y79_13060 [Phototrophicus methaneseepsis]